MNNLLEESKIEYSKLNFVDPVGRIFFKDNRVFRAITPEYLCLCREWFESGLIKELEEKKLIPKTTITDYKLKGYSLILEHEKIISTFPSEWCFSMIKDATLALIEVNEICNKYGFQIKDGHLWNIAFHLNKPVFLDLGSIVHFDKKVQGSFLSEFRETTILPLILWSMNEDYFAQKLLENPVTFYKWTLPSYRIWQSGFIKNVINKFLWSKFPIKSGYYLFRKIFTIIKGKNKYKCEDILYKLVIKNIDKDFIKNKIKVPKSLSTMWKDYQTNCFNEIREGNLNNQFKRFEKITQLIKGFSSDAQSITDIAGNMGGMLYYLEQNSDQFKQLINLDYDETVVEKSYKQLKELNSKVESYLMNLMLPKRDNIADYLNSDVVLALALTHHLLLTQNYKIDVIFNKIKSFSNKYVYIEFMPLGLWAGDDKNTPELPNWYNTNWFRENFSKHFNILHEEQLEKNRIMFVGTIK